MDDPVVTGRGAVHRWLMRVLTRSPKSISSFPVGSKDDLSSDACSGWAQACLRPATCPSVYTENTSWAEFLFGDYSHIIVVASIIHASLNLIIQHLSGVPSQHVPIHNPGPA